MAPTAISGFYTVPLEAINSTGGVSLKNGNTDSNDTTHLNRRHVDNLGTLNGCASANEVATNEDTVINGALTYSQPNGPYNVSSNYNDQPIAICGMACRLPGGLNTPQQLWEFVLAKGDARSRVPESRYNVDAFYDPSGRPGTVKTEYGYFLDYDISKSDGAFSSFVRGATEREDPHQRQMSEVARECIEDAGETNYRGGLIGCYVGSFGEDWCEMFAKDTQQYGLYRVAGYGDFMLSNNVAYEMDLKGPSMTLRTGCSAALVGLHEAVTAIQRGDCTSAIVGGVNLILAPGMTQAMTEQGVLSPDGSCKTFSSEANGYGRGEAVCAVYIKPLDAALRDGNPIRAVIKGTATNFDGRTNGISLPSTEAHEALMRQAYARAGITNFSDTTFVECHGTGTPIGDPIEAGAVARVFGGSERGVYIGSVKPNLGHSEGASGLTSLIKTVMALENRTIPPNIKFTPLNPNIPFEERNIKIANEPTPWPEDGYERASVNSFGIGGTNAHAILESARSQGVKPVKVSAKTTEPQLLVFSANSSESLKKMTEAYQSFIVSNPEKLEQVAYTLANGREHHAYRSFAITSGGGNFVPSPSSRAPQQAPKLVMVFTGQGAQWPAMGIELLQQDNSVFQTTIRKLDEYLQEAIGSGEFSIEAELLKRGKKSRLELAEVSQPLCTAVQIGLLDSLASVGVKPDAVVGHSSGEIAAAYASGALTAQEAIVTAFHRGSVAKLQNRAGAMAAIGLGWDDVKTYLEGTTATVACENSPSSVTISGDTKAVEAVVQKIKQSPPNGKEVLARLLKVDKAYHSYHMAEVGEQYMALLTGVSGRAPRKDCLFYSSVTGDLLDEGKTLGPWYWQSNLENPVLFATAVTNILQNKDLGKPAFLEIGPHAAMGGPLRHIMAKSSASLPYISSMMRNQDCIESYLSAIGKLHQLNFPIDFRKLKPQDEALTYLPDLPRYAWDHEESYWYESRLAKEWRHRKFPYHELLGVRIAESTDIEPSWRNMFHLEHSAWIRDHVIVEDIVYPFAGYIGMAAEAIRQVSGIEEGFALRHVVVSTALVVTDDKPVELITTLRPHRLTDSLDGQWWEFSISSHNGLAWTRHCVGQVKALERNGKTSGRDIPKMARKIASRKAYNMMQQAGLCYGPNFQALQEIKTGTVESTAAAKVYRPKFDVESTSKMARYHLHPIIVDACLQILSLAATKGYTKKHGMVIPTLIEEIKVFRTETDVDISASASVNGVGAIIGLAECVDSTGEAVLQMKGACLSPLPGQETSADAKDTHPTARYQWAPQIDFMDEASLIDRIENDSDRAAYMKALDDITSKCIYYIQEQLNGLQTPVPHLKKYNDWINQRASKSVRVESEDLLKSITDQAISLKDTPAAGVAAAIVKVANRITTIFQGQDNPLGLLIEDNSLNQVNLLRDLGFDASRLIQQLAHSKPSLKILELGGDTGAHTSELLNSLILKDGRVMYSTYTFSDSSSGMVSAAKEQFKLTPNMQFTTLDINRDLEEQSFGDEQYDVIIATNILHTSAILGEGLANVRKLLRPSGRLLLTEFSSTSKWMNLILGLLPWWWSGEKDGRAEEPYANTQHWETALRNAGLGTAAILADTEQESLRRNNLMIVKPIDDKGTDVLAASNTITLLELTKSDKPNPIVSSLEAAGFKVNRRVFGEDEVPAREDVIALLDQDSAFFDKLDTYRYDAFKKLVETISNSGARLFWVTRLCQMACEDPAYAQVLGTARTLRSELSVRFATCEVDDFDSSIDSVVEVFEKFQGNCIEGDDEVDPDYEYSIVDKVVHVGRFAPFSLEEELLSSDESGRVVLETKKPGILAALNWVRRDAQKLQGDLVEVQTYAAGLNFRDVLSANGIVEIPQEGFGLEASGVVSAVGPEVKGLSVGDRVFLFSRGSFSTSVTIPENLCQKIPDGLSLEDAATMPCVYATAMYALFNAGRLQRGQSVLIHSACGGVGIAAIQLARMIGADIYVTVGNEEKVKYLTETFNVPHDRIFNSRDSSFVEGIAGATQGKGIDVVLNSLSGDLLHATWRCVAEFGTMVEIGKRDLLGFGKLDMDVFLANRSYCCVDLDQICFKRQPLCKELLKSVVEAYEAGHILPIRPIEVFSAAKVREAFRYMQQGLHMGKIVISIRDSNDGALGMDTSNVKRKQVVHLDESASYLLVGGLGGLGRAVSRWMVEHNARHLVYLSRSAGANDEDQQFIQELESMGGRVTLVKGSVVSADDVQRAVEAAPNLKGILQMSMVLRDLAWDKLTLDEWTQAASPKVEGTWNLHRATERIDLDFFVLFSSISGVIGQPGQANYAAANTFLDAFSLYRSSKGLPVAAVDIGAVDDIGVISNNENLRRAMLTTGAYMIKETELLEAVGAAMMMSRTSTNANFVLGLASTIPLNSPNNRALWKKDMRMAAYRNISGDGEGGAGAGSDTMKALLATIRHDEAALKDPETAKTLAYEIGRKLFSLVLRSDDEIQTSARLPWRTWAWTRWWLSRCVRGGGPRSASILACWSCWAWVTWMPWASMRLTVY
ncbi:polyketide synthase [Colletotrichum truncatum]|uniref:Polyketide synthase n=1 Tax=Colletotrichum truncatum TaxID=5467 RepID=A0ACC3ZF42_COLTU